ncbi:MAG: DNA primase, partial [Pseudomonadota bacterium]|nr:DNA primase [Pseudomonadota bacterium]
IDTEKSFYVVEGPFDSTFVNNSIALCGSDGDIEHFKECNYVYAYDNEPRNKEIVSRIERCIRDNKRVVIWPRGIEQKDINDMVLAGYDIMSMLESNTYSGLEAQVQFNIWKKI